MSQLPSVYNDRNKNDIVNPFLSTQRNFNQKISNLFYEMKIEHSPMYKLQLAREHFTSDFKAPSNAKSVQTQKPTFNIDTDIKKIKAEKIINEIHFINDRLNIYDDETFTSNTNNFFSTAVIDSITISHNDTSKPTNSKKHNMSKNKSCPLLYDVNKYDVNLNKDVSHKMLNSFNKTIVLKRTKPKILFNQRNLPPLKLKILTPTFPNDKTNTYLNRMKLYEMREKAEKKCKLIPFKY